MSFADMTTPNSGQAVPTFEVRPVETSPRKNLAVPFGILLLVLAILLSGSFLESTLFPPGTITATTRRAPALALGRGLLAVLGVYLLLRRPRITAIHLAALLPGGLVAAIAGAILLQFAYVPRPIISGWRSLAPKSEHNNFGFRGRPIEYSADDYVILLLGDSQVEATALPFDKMPERQLQSSLERQGRATKVFSLGTGGYGQDQELLALKEYLAKRRADMVVLWQTPGNDVWNNLFNTHMANRNPKPTFWLDPSGSLQGPTESFEQPLANSPIVFVALWQRAFGLPWRDRSWERSLPEPYAPMTSYDGPVRTEWQERWNTNLGRMRDENLDTEKSHMTLLLAPRSKRTQYGLDLTRALMERIQTQIGATRGKFVAFYVADEEAAAEKDQVFVLNKKYYRVSQRQFQENWTYVNRGLDAERIPLTVKDWRVSPEDGHLNQRATDQVMADLAARLQSRIPGHNLAAPIPPGTKQ
jgi:hypothetical protein